MKTAKCKVCHRALSLVLSPFEGFAEQQSRLFRSLCSAYCERIQKHVKSDVK